MGYLARCGQIIDATLVPVPTQRNGRTENAQIKQGETPEGWSAKKLAQEGCRRPLDREARQADLRLQAIGVDRLPLQADPHRACQSGQRRRSDPPVESARPEQFQPRPVCRSRLHRAGGPRSGWRVAGGNTSNAEPSRNRRSPQRGECGAWIY